MDKEEGKSRFKIVKILSKKEFSMKIYEYFKYYGVFYNFPYFSIFPKFSNVSPFFRFFEIRN